MATMWILRGTSGSGKSTLALKLSQINDGFVFENDTYHIDDNGVYRWRIENQHAAQEDCYSCCRWFMESCGGENDVIIANTNTTKFSVNKYLDLAKEFNYDVISLVVENRHGGKNIHEVPSSVVEIQAKEIMNSLKLI